MSFASVLQTPKPVWAPRGRDTAFWESQSDNHNCLNTILPLFHTKESRNELALTTPADLQLAEKQDFTDPKAAKPSGPVGKSRFTTKSRLRSKSKRRQRDPLTVFLLMVQKQQEELGAALEYQPQQHQQGLPIHQNQTHQELSTTTVESNENGSRNGLNETKKEKLTSSWRFWIIAAPTLLGAFGTLCIALVNVFKLFAMHQ